MKTYDSKSSVNKTTKTHAYMHVWVHTCTLETAPHLSPLTPQLQLGVANSVRVAAWRCGGSGCVSLLSDVRLNLGCFMSVPAKQPGLSKVLTGSLCRRLWLMSLDAAKPFRPTGLLPSCAGKTAANC